MKKKLSKIIFGLILTIFSYNYSFASYNCDIEPQGIKIFGTLEDGGFGFLSIFGENKIEYTGNLENGKTRSEMSFEKCPNISGNFDTSCRFSGTGGIQFFKFKNLTENNFDENGELNTCPYQLQNSLSANSPISYSGLSSTQYFLALSNPSNPASILYSLSIFAISENPLFYMNGEDILIFGGKRNDLYDNAGRNLFKNFEGNLKLKITNSGISGYVYNSPGEWGIGKIEKNYIKPFPYTFGNNCNKIRITNGYDDEGNPIRSCISQPVSGDYYAKPNGKGCYNPSRISCSRPDRCDNDDDSNNFRYLFSRNPINYSTATNAQCSQKVGLSGTLFRHNGNISKKSDGNYLIIGGKKIQNQNSTLENEIFANDIWEFKPEEANRSLNIKGEFSKLEINNLNSGENIIGGKYLNGNTIILTKSSNGNFNIKKLNGNNLVNIYSNINIGNKNNNFGYDFNCDSNNQCRIVFLGGSNQSNISFTNNDSKQLTKSNTYNNFSNKLKYFDFNLSGNSTQNGEIEINKKIFGFQNLSNPNDYINPGIVNPSIYLNNNLDLYITSYKTAIYLDGNNTNEDTCIYTTSGPGYYLDEYNQNVILLKNGNYGNGEVLPLSPFGGGINMTGIEEVNDNVPDINLRSIQNNIYEYENGKSYIYKKGKQIVNCAYRIGQPYGGIFMGVRVFRTGRKSRTPVFTYSFGTSYLPVEIRSGFYKWGSNGNEKDNESEIKLSPIQSIGKENKISFGGNFELSEDKVYFGTIIKKEGTSYCANKNCSSTGEFLGFTKDFFENYIEINNRRVFTRVRNPGQWTNGGGFCYKKTPGGAGSNCSNSAENQSPLEIKIKTGSVINQTNIEFANLLGDNFNSIENNGNVKKGSFFYQKEFSPGFHRIHVLVMSKPNHNVTDTANNKSRVDKILESAQGLGIGGIPKGRIDTRYKRRTYLNPNDFKYRNISNWKQIADNFRIEYKAYVYEFYIPEIKNIPSDGNISGVNPTFVGSYIPSDSQLFFYTGENENNNFRLNDIPKNNIGISTGYTLNGGTGNNHSERINNIVKLVDNSELHQKIRPSANTGDTVGEFKYSPILGFEKNKDNYLKYFYIDSKGNIIGGESEKFRVGTGSNLSFYNKVNKNGTLITDSVKPFISGDYEKNKEMDINFLGEGKIKIKSNENGNFIFQLNKNLEEGKEYFLNFNGITPNQKLKISSQKLIPEIISHKSGEIEASEKPIFFGNGKAGENIKIEVYTENQKNLNEKFSEIECKNILDGNGKNQNLNGGNSFSQTKIYSCSELGELGEKNILSQTSITVNENGNWSWQLDENLRETNNFDSENIYFVKVYYNGEENKNYDLISFRYLPKEDFETFNSVFKDGDSTGNYLEKIGNNLKITLNSGTGSEIDIFDKSGTGTIKVNGGNNFSVKIPPYSGIEVGNGITSTGILVEKGMRIYEKISGKTFLNQENKLLNLNIGDKIFSGAKESEVKFSEDLEIFSFGKIKIFPNSGKIFVEFSKNLDFFVNDFDKINLGFFDKIRNYFSENSGNGKKYSNNPFSGSPENLLKEYKNNLQTILNSDQNSSNKNFKIGDSFNGKLVRVGEKFLVKGTAWPETLLKISIDDKTVGSVYSDKDGTFTFYIPKYLEYKIGIFTTNIHKIRIDNNEQKNLSEEFYFSMNDNFSGSYLQDFNISNSERNFREKEGFINFSEKIKKIPEFFE